MSGSGEGNGRRIVVTFHEGTIGGATRSTLRAIDGMRERGWEFSFWVSKPSPLYDHLVAEGADVEGCPRSLGFSKIWLTTPPGPADKLKKIPAWLSGWVRFVRDRDPVLVHANSLYTLPEAVLARTMRRPAVLHIHEMVPTHRKGRAARALIKAAGITPVAVSQASAELLANGGRLPHIAYESSPVPDEPTVRPENPDPVVVGTVGWVCPRKGTDIFIEAARRVKEQAPDVEFRLVGPTDPESHEYPWMLARVEEAKEAGIVYFPKARTFEQLKEWDLFVLTSRFDPFPLVVLEAMASAVPVVCTAVDGMVEQVSPETGLLARSEDPGDVAAKILELVRDNGRRRRMGAAARERVAGNFTEHHQAARLEQAYLHAIEKG